MKTALKKLCLIWLFLQVSNGQNLITLNAEKDFVLVGDSPKYVCTVYQTAEFLIENPLNWEKRGRDGSKLVISVLANVEEGLASEFELQLATTDNSISFILSFLEGIKEEYDGYFACVLYKRWNATVLTEKKVDVHVIKTIKKTEFVIADHLQTADGKPELEEGTYNPICKTEGSNPPAVVKIYLGNTELMGYPKVEVQNTSSNQPQRVYNVEKRVTIRLDINDNNKILKCVVQVIADTKCIMRAEMLYQLKVLNKDGVINQRERTYFVTFCVVSVVLFGSILVHVGFCVKLIRPRVSRHNNLHEDRPYHTYDAIGTISHSTVSNLRSLNTNENQGQNSTHQYAAHILNEANVQSPDNSIILTTMC